MSSPPKVNTCCQLHQASKRSCLSHLHPFTQVIFAKPPNVLVDNYCPNVLFLPSSPSRLCHLHQASKYFCSSDLYQPPNVLAHIIFTNSLKSSSSSIRTFLIKSSSSSFIHVIFTKSLKSSSLSLQTFLFIVQTFLFMSFFSNVHIAFTRL